MQLIKIHKIMVINWLATITPVDYHLHSLLVIETVVIPTLLVTLS